jgi:hypothetical protein
VPLHERGGTLDADAGRALPMFGERTRRVSSAPSLRAKPIDLANMGKAYWIGMLFLTGVLIFCWFDSDVGPGHPVCALLVTACAFFLTPGVAVPAVRLAVRVVPHRWFRVAASERVLHRALGVGIFGWLLERSGWNRHVADPLRGFDGTRAGLPSLAHSARGGEIAHGACFVFHLLFAAAALFTGHPWGAVWIFFPGVIFHLYPLLLQRSILLRLQPLFDRSGSQPW